MKLLFIILMLMLSPVSYSVETGPLKVKSIHSGNIIILEGNVSGTIIPILAELDYISVPKRDEDKLQLALFVGSTQYFKLWSPGESFAISKDGHLLAVVYRSDKDNTQNNTSSLQEYLLKRGFAIVDLSNTSIPEDIKNKFLTYENEAKSKNLGLWNKDDLPPGWTR